MDLPYYGAAIRFESKKKKKGGEIRYVPGSRPR
jgi:hypothetical protein